MTRDIGHALVLSVVENALLLKDLEQLVQGFSAVDRAFLNSISRKAHHRHALRRCPPHEAAAAELRQRPPFPLNDLTYLANYVAIFEAYFRQRGRREA